MQASALVSSVSQMQCPDARQAGTVYELKEIDYGAKDLFANIEVLARRDQRRWPMRSKCEPLACQSTSLLLWESHSRAGVAGYRANQLREANSPSSS